ncbi:hypothetical protein HDR63_02060 [bacterium]|nr:hypothetical protein [bacterium]
MTYQEHFQGPKKKRIGADEWALGLVAVAYLMKPSEIANDADINRWVVSGGLFVVAAIIKTVSVVKQIRANKKQSLEQMIQQERQQRARAIKRLSAAISR